MPADYRGGLPFLSVQNSLGDRPSPHTMSMVMMMGEMGNGEHENSV
jgi:hypothetical protein